MVTDYSRKNPYIDFKDSPFAQSPLAAYKADSGDQAPTSGLWSDQRRLDILTKDMDGDRAHPNSTAFFFERR